MGAISETIEEVASGKPSLLTRISKNKYAKIGLLAAFGIATTLCEIASGHCIDKANKKAYTKEQ